MANDDGRIILGKYKHTKKLEKTSLYHILVMDRMDEQKKY